MIGNMADIYEHVGNNAACLYLELP
jgi:hypothetical protein